jgi:4-diphosphocytidyl-2-C-methyl-D-erythritol kinase
MQLSRYVDDVVVWTPAKINLFLEVLGKRPDGYHDIHTLMVAIRLYDTLVFRSQSSGLHLDCSRKDLSAGPDNLVLRAARLLQERTGCAQGARIRLVKRIPLAAGLAGGSSDAAATLLGLSKLWQLGLPRAELAKLGAELGSDVPFFFHSPAAWCTGRGEIVKPVAVNAQPLELVLLCPPFGMMTADVYRHVKVPAPPQSGETIRSALTTGNAETLGPLLFNRLEEAALAVDGRLAGYRQRLAERQPAGLSLSGSGSSWFALCRSNAEATSLATALASATDGYVLAVRSCV